MDYLFFLLALALLIQSARFFTQGAEKWGKFLGMPEFVIGIFIVGIGTSLPELIASMMSTYKGISEIVPGNIMGANISNILLITGTVALIHKIDIHLSSRYIFIDLHYLIGCIFVFVLICVDGNINWIEGLFCLFIFVVYSLYLIKNEIPETTTSHTRKKGKAPWKALLFLMAGAAGIFFGADYTITYLEKIALDWKIPASIVALTILSLGTTLPELVVNIGAIRQGKAEMAIGNVLGSCVFNLLVVPAGASFIGTVSIPDNLLHFSLPVMAASGLFFYLLTHDKRISRWEGMLFILLYLLFVVKVSGF